MRRSVGEQCAVYLDGWVRLPSEAYVWTNDAGDQLSLHYFSTPPDLPAPLSDLTTIRQFCRQQLGERGALVEVEAVTLERCSALRTILKMSQGPAGMTYVAAVTIPFAECSFVAKVVCPELGVTGMTPQPPYQFNPGDLRPPPPSDIQAGFQEDLLFRFGVDWTWR